MYYTYIIRCEDNSLYTGMTSNLERRLEEHFCKDKKCAKYTMSHNAKKLESAWQSESRVLASKLEYRIKKLNKEEKEQLIKDKNNKLLNIFLGDTIEVDKYQKIDL